MSSQYWKPVAACILRFKWSVGFNCCKRWTLNRWRLKFENEFYYHNSLKLSLISEKAVTYKDYLAIFSARQADEAQPTFLPNFIGPAKYFHSNGRFGWLMLEATRSVQSLSTLSIVRSCISTMAARILSFSYLINYIKKLMLEKLSHLNQYL